ncbi:MAG: hypothetical protein FWC53_02200 [Firmicutes bacterium]|nr:hypothetical protein [Bacillota bacterium]
MAYPYRYKAPSVQDEITELKIEGEGLSRRINVTFRYSGHYSIRFSEQPDLYIALEKMKVGDKPTIAGDRGKLDWVLPEGRDIEFVQDVETPKPGTSQSTGGSDRISPQMDSR